MGRKTMGRKAMGGLFLRGGIWHVDKYIGGRRVCRSTNTPRLEEAERYLAHMIETQRQAEVYGVRPSRTFAEAAARYVRENKDKRSLGHDISNLNKLVPLLGERPIDEIHGGVMQPWIEQRRLDGRAAGTINHTLKVLSRILKLAATEWMDDTGLTWLAAAPKIKLLTDNNKRQPYPLTWAEQERLFAELPQYLAQMALFAVNTGCRDQEICALRWAWEVEVPQLATSVFIVPGNRVKNGDDRLIVLNRIAKGVVNARRNINATYVFTYEGKPITRMMTTAWKRARARLDLATVRVHDLKHTFGRRLRAAGVSFEDRQDLLGHRSGRITTHYSAAELSHLLAAANSVCDTASTGADLVVLRGTLRERAGTGRELNSTQREQMNEKSRKTPARELFERSVNKAKRLI
jgi:integrase